MRQVNRIAHVLSKSLTLATVYSFVFCHALQASQRGALIKAEVLNPSNASVKAINVSKSAANMNLSREEFPTLSRVDTYKLTFATIDHKDRPIESTGLILLPADFKEALPFLSYQHATRMHPREAPTALPVDPEARANLILYASRGYVVTMADYLGLDKINVDSAQFYLNAEIQARVAFDLMLATQSFLASIQHEFRREVFIGGYSQGAHNALGLHKYIQQQRNKEMKVLGTAAMSGPYSISRLARQVLDQEVKTKINPVFVGLALFGMHEAYESFPRFTEILQPEPAAKLPLFLKKGKFNEVRAALPSRMSELFQLERVFEIMDADDDDPFWQALVKNDVDNFLPNAPVLMIHSSTDEVIPYASAKASFDQLKGLGADIQMLTYDQAKCDHVEAAFPAFLKAARFFNRIQQ